MLGISKFKTASIARAFPKMKKDYFCTAVASRMGKEVSLTDALKGVSMGSAGMEAVGCGEKRSRFPEKGC